MIKKNVSSIVLTLTVSIWSFAQDSFNIQELTPSVLLPTGKWEIKSFNSNYSQTQFFDKNGKRVDESGSTLYNDNGTIKSNTDVTRNTFFTSVNQINYGLNSKINIGVDFWVSASERSAGGDSRLGVMNFRQSANSRTGLSYIGAKIKFVPISSVSNFSVQSLFLIPVAKDLESRQQFPRPFLNWDNYTWVNQLFLDVPLDSHWLLFLNIDAVWGISRNESVSQFRGNRFTIPVKVFVNYFATNRLTMLLQTEYNRIWEANGDEVGRQRKGAYYFQLGPSVKYQLITSKLESEVGYSYFAAGSNGQGAGSSINLGLRLLL